MHSTSAWLAARASREKRGLMLRKLSPPKVMPTAIVSVKKLLPNGLKGTKPMLTKPRAPQDLTAHSCVNLRLPTAGGLYAWEFAKNGRDLKVRVEGQLVVNTVTLALRAALEGAGLAYVLEQRALPHLGSGELVRVLAPWCPPFAGFHLYYPSRRQHSPAFALVIEALRYRPPASPEP